MALDLSDPEIAFAYEDVLNDRGKDWLLLGYTETRDKLSLLRTGAGNIDELRESIPADPDDVCFGFCRERDDDGTNFFALVAYIPDEASGVRRARALVHSRAVANQFKAHNTILSVNSRDAITSEKLRERLDLSPSLIPRLAPNNRIIQRSASEPSDPRPLPSEPRDADRPVSPRVRGHASEHLGRVSPVIATIAKRAVSQPQVIHIPPKLGDDKPPPTPPKDHRFAPTKLAGLPSRPNQRIVNNIRAANRSELAYLSDSTEESDGLVPVSPGSTNSDGHPRGRSKFSSLPARPAPRMLSPEEKARLRFEAQKRREEEERLALEEEEARQVRLKLEKARILEEAEAEERDRLSRIAEEKRIALAERARRDAEAQAEEERMRQELEERRQHGRERRAENTRRLEEWQSEMARKEEESARRHEEDRRIAEENRREKMKEFQEKIAKSVESGGRSTFLTGNVSVQTSSSITWKRRFFELCDEELLFYRDSTDRSQPLDIMSLSGGRVACIKEPHDGYDELEAIPNSFAVEFKDGDGPWCLFADSAEDKDILISLLSQAAGLS